jgi:hypothetical protein
MRFIKPRGAEQIVYGGKVVCVRNRRRQAYVYAMKTSGDKGFFANEETGMVIGQKQWGKQNPSFKHIGFAGRDDRNFSFTRSAFSGDGRPYLELAYTITELSGLWAATRNESTLLICHPSRKIRCEILKGIRCSRNTCLLNPRNGQISCRKCGI